MSMVSEGQSRAQMVHRVHRSQSTRQMGLISGRAGFGILTMQSTGHTVMQASQPVQPFSLMIALGRGLRGFRAGAAAAGLAADATAAEGAGGAPDTAGEVCTCAGSAGFAASGAVP